jgi:hypothetical protein
MELNHSLNAALKRGAIVGRAYGTGFRPVRPNRREQASYAYEATFYASKLSLTRMRVLPDGRKSFLTRMTSFFRVRFCYFSRMRPVSDARIGTSYAYEVLTGGCF